MSDFERELRQRRQEVLRIQRQRVLDEQTEENARLRTFREKEDKKRKQLEDVVSPLKSTVDTLMRDLARATWPGSKWSVDFRIDLPNFKAIWEASCKDDFFQLTLLRTGTSWHFLVPPRYQYDQSPVIYHTETLQEVELKELLLREIEKGPHQREAFRPWTGMGG